MGIRNGPCTTLTFAFLVVLVVSLPASHRPLLSGADSKLKLQFQAQLWRDSFLAGGMPTLPPCGSEDP